MALLRNRKDTFYLYSAIVAAGLERTLFRESRCAALICAAQVLHGQCPASLHACAAAPASCWGLPSSPHPSRLRPPPCFAPAGSRGNTLLAPNDAAFEKLLTDLNTNVTELLGDEELLQNVLRYVSWLARGTGQTRVERIGHMGCCEAATTACSCGRTTTEQWRSRSP